MYNEVKTSEEAEAIPQPKTQGHYSSGFQPDLQYRLQKFDFGPWHTDKIYQDYNRHNLHWPQKQSSD